MGGEINEPDHVVLHGCMRSMHGGECDIVHQAEVILVADGMWIQISCSCCGHRSQKLPYDTNRTPDRIIKAGWDSFGSAFYCPKCVKTWEERNGKDRPLWGKEHTHQRILEEMVSDLLDMVHYLKTGEWEV